MINVSITGLDRLQKHIAKMAEPNKTFDEDVKNTAINSIRELVKGSQGQSAIKTGQTARAWTPVVKLSDSVYMVTNDQKSEDKEHLIVNILNYGHKEIYPKKAKKLFIPLTNRGVARDTGIEFGKDFILADKVRATEGSKFIQKEQERASKELVQRMQKTIKAVHSGQ